jgi:hypothetical protein
MLPERVSRLVADEEHGPADGARRAIGYPPYRDSVGDEVEEVEDENDNAYQRVIEGGGQPPTNAFTSPGANREQEQRNPLVENEWARG